MENKKSVFSSILQSNSQEHSDSANSPESNSYFEKIEKRILELEQKILGVDKSDQYLKNIDDLNKKFAEQEKKIEQLISLSESANTSTLKEKEEFEARLLSKINEMISHQNYLEKQNVNILKNIPALTNSNNSSELNLYLEKIEKRILELEQKILGADKSDQYLKNIDDLNKKFAEQEKKIEQLISLSQTDAKNTSDIIQTLNEKFDLLKNEFEKDKEFISREKSEFESKILSKLSEMLSQIKDYQENQIRHISELISDFHSNTSALNKELLDNGKNLESLMDKNANSSLDKLDSMEKNLKSFKESISSLSASRGKLEEKVLNITETIKNLQSFIKTLLIEMSEENNSKFNDLLISQNNSITEKIDNSLGLMEEKILKLYVSNIGDNIEVEKLKMRMKEIYEKNLSSYNTVKMLISEIRKERLDYLPGVSGELVRKNFQAIEKIEGLLKSNLEIMESIKYIGKI